MFATEINLNHAFRLVPWRGLWHIQQRAGICFVSNFKLMRFRHSPRRNNSKSFSFPYPVGFL